MKVRTTCASAARITLFASLPLLGSALSGCASVSLAAEWPIEHPVGYEEEYEAYAEVPPGHLPPPGECRIWYPGRPPGHQPPPGACHRLERQVPPGAVLVYGD